jgi:hypothetical protein
LDKKSKTAPFLGAVFGLDIPFRDFHGGPEPMAKGRRNAMTRNTEKLNGNGLRCIHKKVWGQCACCRGKFGMLAIELDILLGRNQPPEIVGNLVATAIQTMRRGKEEMERRGTSPG